MNPFVLLIKRKTISKLGKDVFKSLPSWIQKHFQAYEAALEIGDGYSASLIMDHVTELFLDDYIGQKLFSFCRSEGLNSLKDGSPFCYISESGTRVFAPFSYTDAHLSEMIAGVKDEVLEKFLVETFDEKDLKGTLLRLPNSVANEQLYQITRLLKKLI